LIGATVVLLLSFIIMAHSAVAQVLRGEGALLGQVREGDQSRKTETPVDFYGQATVSELWRSSSINTFFRVEQDFARSDTKGDFYTGFIDIPAAIPGLQAVGGRQFLNESPNGVMIADAGKLRLDPGWPVSFTAFGGKPRYFDPAFSSDVLSEDEIVWGGSMRAGQLAGANLSLGYQQFERKSKVLQQLVSATVSRSFSTLPGVPRLYSSIAYDADHQNLDLFTGGADILLGNSGLQLNAEGSYYKPQDHEDSRPARNINRREDPIYELFSTSEMGQGRAGLRYAFSAAFATFCDYSFQHYDQIKNDQAQNSHVASAGVLWLPEGDGLEIVRAEYYILETEDDRAVGGKVLYENRVYERILFRTKLDVTGYDTAGNQGDVAVSGLLGVGYALARNLSVELNFEANHNDRFDEDFRFGFFIDYNFRHAFGPTDSDLEAAS
jgi:hypothetical protein